MPFFSALQNKRYSQLQLNLPFRGPHYLYHPIVIFRTKFERKIFKNQSNYLSI